VKACPDRVYDIALCRHTFEHLPTAYVSEVLTEITRVFKFALLSSTLLPVATAELDFPRQTFRPLHLESSPFVATLGMPLIRFFDGLPSQALGASYLNLYCFGAAGPRV
jgi:hypothetical protein